MKKVKYVIKTKEQILLQRLIAYIVIIVVLSIFGLITYKSWSEVKTLSNIEKPKEEVKIVATNEKVDVEENENLYQIKEILGANTSTVLKKTLNVDDVDLDYTTQYQENPELPSGTIRVVQEGNDGVQKMIILKTYQGEEFKEEERISGEVTEEAVDKIVEIGTGEGTNNYVPRAGDSIYATPETVKIREAASRKANEIGEIKKDEKAVIVEVVNNNWVKIQYQKMIGYSDVNCFTNINPNGPTTFATGTGIEYPKEQLMSILDFNMDLSKPSGLSIEQFRKILSGNPGDKQGVLASNAEYFYYCERQYGINGVFLASMAIHEGGWGTSKIANDKKNLFGYGAYDSNPYGGASSFSTYAEGIDLVARVLVKNYLHPKGEEIYDGQIANGTYFNGPTLTGVNTRYASDKNWANAVFKWMTYLYNRL